MVSAGLFTQKDISTISKAAALAENLTQQYFNSAEEWKREPYLLFTLQQVGKQLYERHAFANVIQVTPKSASARSRYGIILQDPNILLALLRSHFHDLWTLGLFVLTHEMVHILRFRKYNVDFFASQHERDKEEKIVHAITREILAGAGNTDYIIKLFEQASVGCDASDNWKATGGN